MPEPPTHSHHGTTWNPDLPAAFVQTAELVTTPKQRRALVYASWGHTDAAIGRLEGVTRQAILQRRQTALASIARARQVAAS